MLSSLSQDLHPEECPMGVRTLGRLDCHEGFDLASP